MATKLAEIQSKTKVYADARNKLVDIVTELNNGIEALKRQHMGALKRAVASTAQHHDELKALIDANQDLFVKPRSAVFHGIKVGLKKAKGKIEYSDAGQVVKLIRKNFKRDAWNTLIKVEETPLKAGLEQLAASDLKKLGCTVIQDGDEVLIKAIDSDVDKLVTALLKESSDEVAG